MEGCHGKLPVVSLEPQMKFILVLVAIIERGNYSNASGQHRKFFKSISANISRIAFVGKIFNEEQTYKKQAIILHRYDNHLFRIFV
jgi:hypothetical protein